MHAYFLINMNLGEINNNQSKHIGILQGIKKYLIILGVRGQSVTAITPTSFSEPNGDIDSPFD